MQAFSTCFTVDSEVPKDTLYTRCHRVRRDERKQVTYLVVQVVMYARGKFCGETYKPIPNLQRLEYLCLASVAGTELLAFRQTCQLNNV